MLILLDGPDVERELMIPLVIVMSVLIICLLRQINVFNIIFPIK